MRKISVINISNITSVVFDEYKDRHSEIRIRSISDDVFRCKTHIGETDKYLKLIHYAIHEGRGALFIEIDEFGYILRLLNDRIEA